MKNEKISEQNHYDLTQLTSVQKTLLILLHSQQLLSLLA